jgi:hypothetical protein
MAAINEPAPRAPESDDREEWSTPRVIVSDIRLTDKTINLDDGVTTAS